MPPTMTRRGLVRAAAATCASGWLAPLAATLADAPARKRSCVLLWMNGGPATIDLWDLKPGHANGGPFKEVATATPGLRISEHLPKLAGWSERMAIVRSLSSTEGDHGRASHLLRAGYTPQGAIQYPAFGAVLARELSAGEADVPPYVSIAPAGRDQYNLGGGFLGPRFNPLVLGEGDDATLKVPNLDRPADDLERRLVLLEGLNRRFADGRASDVVESRRTATAAAAQLLHPTVARAFDLGDEKAAVRDAYGRGLFGQGCLLARRLVERGVPFVEVSLGGWDTHSRNFPQVQELATTVDAAWSSLMADLKERGLLDMTLVVWMGEFGRTPKINPAQGRDHWPNAFSAVLAGGGIKGGQDVGKTSADGLAVAERPVSVPDLLATVCVALGVDPRKQNLSNVNRPIRVVDRSAEPLEGVAG